MEISICTHCMKECSVIEIQDETIARDPGSFHGFSYEPDWFEASDCCQEDVSTFNSDVEARKFCVSYDVNMGEF